MSRRVAVPLLAAIAGAGSLWPPAGRWAVHAGAGHQAGPLPEGTPVRTCPDGATPEAGAPTSCVEERLILDRENSAWMDVGQRTIGGIVYHRLFGTLEGTDRYLRRVPAEGVAACAGFAGDPSYGGCLGLQDFGVDNVTGAIYWWNDPTGQAHEGVSPNRAGFANGPVHSPTAAVQAFIEANGDDLNAVNRDLVSIAIAGFADDPISDVCLNAVAALSADIASWYPVTIPWHDYPSVPDQETEFVFLHNEVNAGSSCPGQQLINRTPEIVFLTAEILRDRQATRAA